MYTNTLYTSRIFTHIDELPSAWDSIPNASIFLSRNYLQILAEAAPANMQCQYIGVFDGDVLVAKAIVQLIDLSKLGNYGSRDSVWKRVLRNFLFYNFAAKLVFVGNNLLTGQHAFSILPEEDSTRVLATLRHAIADYQPYHMAFFKDFVEEDLSAFAIPAFKNDYQFSSQPNMSLAIRESWKSESDYVADLTKKYRDQFKRARKKAAVIEKRKFDLVDIIAHENQIHALYMHVAEHAPFNTFFLPMNHWRIMKSHLQDDFRFFAYFIDDTLIGFNTLIHHDDVLETYFLGYEEEIQRDKMLYLNMLYDMIACGISNGFKEINFGRTALEIKSSVGAEPVEMFGFMSHTKPFINKRLATIFRWLEPTVTWNNRSPFRA